MKGDGQGGNNCCGNRAPVEIGQLDLLLNRIELHRKCASGEIPSSEPADYHAAMAQSVQEELDKLTEANGGWKLEVLEHSEQLKAAIAAWTTEGHEDELAVAELGIDERLLTQLDERGVIWVRQLLKWTEPMLMLLPCIGEVTIAELQKTLAGRGLKLRRPRSNEKPKLPRVLYRLESISAAKKRPGMKPRESTRARHKAFLMALADGALPQDVGSKWNVSNELVYNFRSWIARRIRDGESPLEVAKSFDIRHGAARSRVVKWLETLH